MSAESLTKKAVDPDDIEAILNFIMILIAMFEDCKEEETPEVVALKKRLREQSNRDIALVAIYMSETGRLLEVFRNVRKIKRLARRTDNDVTDEMAEEVIESVAA